jgi:hypothetical protein
MERQIRHYLPFEVYAKSLQAYFSKDSVLKGIFQQLATFTKNKFHERLQSL